MENLDKVFAKRIAEEYAPKTTTKVVQLKKLDQKVKSPANIFAYTFGRKIGKHKLWPAISPNKTWEGTIAGIIMALVLSGVYMYFVPQEYSMTTMLMIAFVLSIMGQMGDLIESAYKRYYKVKDSGNILPGHGGILDRFDSMLIVLPLLHIFGLV